MKFDRALAPAVRHPLRTPKKAVAAVAVAAAMPGPATRTPAKVSGVEPTDPTSEVGREEEVSPLENSHAVTRDQAEQNKTKPAMIDYLRHAQKKSGRHPMGLVREYLRLHRGCGKLTWPEYVQYGVYDKTRNRPEDQSRFLTNTLHWPITHVCCDMTWQTTTEDELTGRPTPC